MARNRIGNVSVHVALSCFPPSPGAMLQQDSHALCLRVECLIATTNALSRHLAAVSSEESERGTGEPPAGEDPTGGQGGGGLLMGGAGLHSQVVYAVD